MPLPEGPAAGGLSAVLIAKDEQDDLPGCLESLRGLAEEIVVVIDPQSGDATEALARRAGAKVLLRPFDDYASQKQASVDLASREWVLSMDCDESLTPDLREEIRRVLPSAQAFAGFEIPFEVHFMNRRMRFGGLSSEKHLRLFRRSAGRFGGGALHEGIVLQGPVGRLSGRIIHRPYRDLSEYLSKLDAYTTLAARKRYGQGRRFRPWHHLIPFWEFFSRVVLKLGLLDGAAGVVWAGLSAFHGWLKYLKLRELERNRGEPS